MSTIKTDMIGKKYGRLTVLEECDKRGKSRCAFYKCRCECGNITYVDGSALRKGNTKSCGCSRKKNHFQTHGKSKTRLYRIWQGMKTRCYNKKSSDFQYYGAKGIKICQGWLDDFTNFYKWAMDNGYKENLTIDRINSANNYDPDNCRWIILEKQQANKKNNIYLTYNGKSQIIAHWAKELKKSRIVIERRHRKGWTDEECLFGKSKKLIYKYDYLTNKVLDSYDTVANAAKVNKICSATIYSELHKNILEYPRRDYYFGFAPKCKYVIKCYDNELLELLGTYKNIKDAAKATAVDARQIQWQIAKDLPFRERISGCTGLWFRREVIDK